jgi:RNA polymerase sigma-70 factor (ECF subfamily)
MSLGMTVELEKLVRMAKEGDVPAMRSLYDENKERILKLALGYSRNMEDAEEILQETFAKAFVALKKNKLRNNRSFPFWLNRIGINTSLDLVKKRAKVQLEKIDADQTISEEHCGGSTPEQESIREETGLLIEQALQILSPKQRVIFTMKHFQHLKIREIAESLGCSEGNIKQQLFRAVRRLKSHLEPRFMEVKNGL